MAVVVDFDGSRRDSAKPALDQINALVADDLVKVNQVIVDKMDSPVALIPQLAGHIIAAGGKRLRPMLTLAASALCGYQGERHISLAACVNSATTCPAPWTTSRDSSVSTPTTSTSPTPCGVVVSPSI